MSKIVDVTVGKYDSSVTYLTTSDFKILEYPSSLLPDNIKTGTVLKIQVAFNEALSTQTNKDFISFQDNLIERMPSFKPVNPVLKVKSRLPTSITVSWDPLSLGIAKLKNVSLWHKSLTPQPSLSSETLDLDDVSSLDEIDEEELSQIATIYNIDSKNFKLTGLNMNSKHVFQLKMDTSNGICASDMIIADTLSSNDLSGFSICVGALSAGKITYEDIEAVAHSLNISHLSRQCNSDTTHYITDTVDDENEEHDQQLNVAKNLNIPIVTPNWLQGCLTEHKLLGVKGFYYKLSKGDKTNASEKYLFDKSFTEEYLGNNMKKENDKSAIEETEGENSAVEAGSMKPAAEEPNIEKTQEEHRKEILEEEEEEVEELLSENSDEKQTARGKSNISVEATDDKSERGTQQEAEAAPETEAEAAPETEAEAAPEEETEAEAAPVSQTELEENDALTEKEAEEAEEAEAAPETEAEAAPEEETEVTPVNQTEPEENDSSQEKEIEEADEAEEAPVNQTEPEENDSSPKKETEENDTAPAKNTVPAAETKTNARLSPSASNES